MNAPSAPGAVAWPEPEDSWHRIAWDWYLSLGDSGQSQFYEPSDVATAQYVAEAMSGQRVTDPTPNDTAAVALELERLRGTMEAGFARVDGALALLVQRSDQSERR